MHNHKVKDLLRYQKGFDVSYNFVEIGLQYFKSLLPYFYFTEAHDNIIGCQKTIMQFVDGENFKNIDVLLKNRYFEVINAILHLRPILNNDSPENLRKEKKLINPSLYSLFEDTARITNDGYIEMKGLRIPLKVIKDNSDCLSCIIDSEILDQVFSKILNAEILKDDAEVVLGEDYVKTKQTKENPRFLKQNAVISILKTKAVSIVLDMLSRDHDYTDKIIYRLRTDVNSEVFRLNFMYQTIMLQTQYGGNYYLSYFNKVYLPSINNITRSSMVIELGHMLYSLVIRMHSLSSEGSVDLGYKRKIFDCLPKEVRNDFEIQRDFFSQIMYFLKNVARGAMNFVKSNQKISLGDKLTEESLSNDLQGYMRFFADKTSQIEIVDENGKLQEYSFILMPHSLLNSEEQNDELIYKLDVTNSSTA